MSSWNHPTAATLGPAAVAMGLGVLLVCVLMLAFCLDLNDPDDVAILPFELRLCVGLWRACCPRRTRRSIQFVYVRTPPDCEDDPIKCVPVGPLHTGEVSQDPT